MNLLWGNKQQHFTWSKYWHQTFFTNAQGQFATVKLNVKYQGFYTFPNWMQHIWSKTLLAITHGRIPPFWINSSAHIHHLEQTTQKVLERNELQFAEIAFCSVWDVPRRSFRLTGRVFFPRSSGGNFCQISVLAKDRSSSGLSSTGPDHRRCDPLRIFDSWNCCESETCLFEYVGLPFSGKCYWKCAK